MHGYPHLTSVNDVRFQMLKKMVGEGGSLSTKSKVELFRLLPCKDALRPYVRRVNYRVALYNKAAKAVVHLEQGWVKVGNHLETQWPQGSILPPTLVDLLSRHDDIVEDDDELQADADYLDEEN